MEIEKEPPPRYKQLTFEHEADALTIELRRFPAYLDLWCESWELKIEKLHSIFY